MKATVKNYVGSDGTKITFTPETKEEKKDLHQLILRIKNCGYSPCRKCKNCKGENGLPCEFPISVTLNLKLGFTV